MNNLDELIKDRKEKVRLMKKDGDNAHKILADLYGNPTHFIMELLQNAEDEGAKNVSFKLTENELLFSHDSEKLFDFNDIRAISNFGDNQEKKEKPNAIGRHGIGFKSVYSITDSPRIVSSDFDITIKDYNIPERTNGKEANFYKGTKIILPFKTKRKQKAYELLDRELKDLNLHYLLFLSNIYSIKWETINENGQYERIISKNDKRFIVLKSSNKELKYFLLDKNVFLDNKNLKIKIAFQLADTDKRIVVPCDKSPLFVFFPTKIETNLKFLVHAPFFTTPARENIQENEDLINIEDDHRNDTLKTELGELLKESLTIFKKLRLLNVDLLNILPIDKTNCNRSVIYNEFYEVLKSVIISNIPIIPNSNGGWSPASHLMLLGSSELANLLNQKQTKKLFGRSLWVSKKITNDKTKILRDYLYYDIDLPEYDMTTFAGKIDEDFLKAQSDKWLVQFYIAVHKAPALWRIGSRYSSNGILRSKPIIRIESKNGVKQVFPFQSNGKPNAFLPTKEKTEYLTVKQNIVKNKNARKFLEEIGLTTPDLFAEINEFIIPKLKSADTYPSYFDDFKKLIEASKSTNNEKRNQLFQDLRQISFILGFNTITGELKHLKYFEVYQINENLSTYFRDNNKTYFVASDQYSLSQNESEKFHKFLSELGVKNTLRRKEFTPNFTWQEKATLRKNASITYENYIKDYKLDGLTVFLKDEITLDKSVALWQLLVKCSSNERNSAIKFFQGEYSYKYYSDYRISFDSYFLKQLQQNAWLVVNEKRVFPHDISYSSLPEVYKTNGNDLRVLGEILGFKPDEIKAIEERTGGKFISAGEYEKYKIWLSEQENNAESDNKETEEDNEGFNPDLKPSEVKLNSREIDSINKNIVFNSEQGESTFQDNNGKKDEEQTDKNAPEEDDKKSVNKPSQKLLNDIGDWGQSYVLLDLKCEFESDDEVEIVDLNNSGKIGVGCDFIIKKKGEIYRLVEVKSTTEKFGQTLSISGTQWEVARNFFNENDGDKYWIYCVFKAGTENAEIVKIRNPIEKWKDGKLLAHPVNFIIK
jgi:hypothetical protein